MLYIMRHGRTDWNDAYKLQGRTDIPLNDAGRRMAQEAAQCYREVSFDVCFCSPLIRARETAEIFLKGRDIPILFLMTALRKCALVYAREVKNVFVKNQGHSGTYFV